MQSSRFSIFRTIPFHLFLLPFFFVLHGYTEFYNLISFSKATVLVFYYLIGTVVVFFICRLFFKTYAKAAVFAFFLMCLYFFFGSFHDFIGKKFPGVFFTKYSFILPVILVLFSIIFIMLKRTKQPLYKITLYLNTLLLILLLADGISLLIKVNAKNNELSTEKRALLKLCNSCPKPDIYLIVADGYSGKIPLQTFLNYDNTPFENQLKERGFYIADSSLSNYNYTVNSVGSLLNMNYLQIPGYYNGRKDLSVSFDAVRYNRIVEYFKNEDYDFFNYSVFDINKEPVMVKSTLLNLEKSPLTTQTFLYRLNKDLGYHLITTFKLKFLQRRLENTLLVDRANNLKIDSLTKNIASLNTNKPRFVYSHFIMPHYSYYFDSTGAQLPDNVVANTHESDRNAYISYLKYTNKKLLSLVDHIQQNKAREAIIILVSDHGCRECLETDPSNQGHELLNFNAVFFPNKNYSGFYKGVSNVNLFRLILNSQFGQNLSLLKDSVTVLKPE